MPDLENQKQVFRFFMKYLETKCTFQKSELMDVTDWKKKSFDTYWSKQFRPFVVEVSPGMFRVSEALRRYTTWDRFQTHVSQVKAIAADYDRRYYSLVRIYEFFMPLTNENDLRTALDALFYRDTIEARLRTIPQDELVSTFPQHESENEKAYADRLNTWISERFGGYSVYHVSGRFRAQALLTRSEAAKSQSPYLVDETTAVARFIFPCESEDDANKVDFLFRSLFVEAVIEIVNGEDEIWMVETGMKTGLHTWEIERSAL